MLDSKYNSLFFNMHSDGSMKSAREIVKIVKEILDPKSVVDVGCGIGTWLRVWLDSGVEDVAGIDGDYVRSEQLLIPAERFVAMNLSSVAELASGLKPIGLRAGTAQAGRFDLVESLEVAEHLPREAADAFVSFLCSLAPVVLFSAAPPHQWGTKHINEQWPEYWAKLFSKRGYVPIDAIRDRVWNHPDVEVWYRQNTLIFARAESMGTIEGLRNLPVVPPQGPLSRIHPEMWMGRNERPLPLEKLLRMLPRSIHAFPRRVFVKLKCVLMK